MLATEDVETPLADRVWTVPNLLSVLRLLGVPLFLWLALGPEADGWAFGVLAPAADRLYILATIVALTVRDIVPLWLAVAVPLRDVLLAFTLPVLRRHGYGPLPVHYLGKAATFNLLYAFPLLLLADHS